jgi:HAD superfamily hydrolase (TIGR01509 family)
MTQLAALIFDVDGTLAETEELHRTAFNDVFAAEGGTGWHWDRALYAELLAVTGGKERIRHYVSAAGLPALDDARVARLHADKTARYTGLVAEGGLVLRPGVRRLLLEARAAGLKLAIATTTSLPNVRALLAACAPVPDFDVIAAGDEVPAKKPAPDIYALALRRLGQPAAACVALEDTENGLASARGAGLRCVMTTSVYGGRGPFPGAAAVVSQLGDAGDPAELLAGPALRGAVVDLAWLEALAHTE